jgi:hypothetical protein
MGIFCDPKHPAFAQFPTEFATNWQWWDMLTYGAPMKLDRLPHHLKPLVGCGPDWFAPQRLGLLFEAHVGRGRVVVCSSDLTHRLAERPAAQQLRASLLRYMESEAFQPATTLKMEQIKELFIPAGKEVNKRGKKKFKKTLSADFAAP